MSQDHNWGPRVLLVVSGADCDAHGAAVVDGFASAAPAAFRGVPIGMANRPHPPPQSKDALGDIRHGLEVWTLERLLGEFLGGPAPRDGLAWLGLAEQRLLVLTAGAVFHDDDGALSAVREQLAYLPRDVWLYKLAGQWRRIAEEQAFVGRTGERGDEIGSRVIAARLVRDLMRLAFLIERRYAPYPKWFGTAFARLPCAPDLMPTLHRALTGADWKTREAALATACLDLAELHRARGHPGVFAPSIGPYYERPFTVINAEEIIAAIRAEILDPALKALPVIGAVDQVSDATPVISDPARARPAMAALLHDPKA